MPLKRSPFRRSAQKPKRPGTLVPKRLGQSARGYKTIPRNQDHMARVAALGCLVCGRPAQFHHVDCCTPKGAGPKVSDYIGAPVCPDHHLVDQNDSAHGYGGERAFWLRHGIDIGAWMLKTLRAWYANPDERVAASIAALEKQRSIENQGSVLSCASSADTC